MFYFHLYTNKNVKTRVQTCRPTPKRVANARGACTRGLSVENNKHCPHLRCRPLNCIIRAPMVHEKGHITYSQYNVSLLYLSHHFQQKLVKIWIISICFSIVRTVVCTRNSTGVLPVVTYTGASYSSN